MQTAPDRFTVAIESGLYEGVVETLAEGRYRIGSDIGVDLVLVEDGIAAQHLVVGLAGRQVRLEAVADGVVVDGIGPLPAGQSQDLPLPLGVAIGSTRIAIARVGADEIELRDPVPQGAAGLERRSLVRVLVTVPALAALIVLVAPNPVADALIRADAKLVFRPAGAGAPPARAAQGASGDPVPSAAPLTGALPTGTSPTQDAATIRPATPATAAVATEKRSSQEAARALHAEVERVGLFTVVVEAGAGVVTASGTIEPAASSQWQAVQQWFDERFAGEITLINGVSVKAEKLPVALGIEAVWRGEPSHLIIRGQKYLEGAVLEGGWTLHRIEPGRVILQRDGRLVAVKY